MNIYFCGIGGVGLGPLAEIARDAGHRVVGSDPKESLMTKQMANHGITIGTDQSGAFLQSSHDEQPIDWFVYTSALPNDHPELLLAQSLGIKSTKRDELLAYIIEEKHLKLIAVAGTHGKTGTTAMTVWTMKQLGIPVSYSIGTTMSFGPSGHYDPASEYFIYECDEYDRNFLQFHPYLSLIASLDYDHPDTYPTRDDYTAAFKQFIDQSESSILWKKDARDLGQLTDAWLLEEHDLAAVTLPGNHYRQNASLVVKAMERLNITGDIVQALNDYPGVDRRFERIAPNLYSDYGVHPAEITATLQLARELNNDVVLVYQPHQNVRQHEIRAQYADSFDLASEIYWLPTYLTRENPDLPVLTPTELTADIKNRAVYEADLDDDLWKTIQNARQRGALVLCMGAGSIDAWVRDKIAE
jgi:UDP-N-acetylmuramate--alanine ligase